MTSKTLPPIIIAHADANVCATLHALLTAAGAHALHVEDEAQLQAALVAYPETILLLDAAFPPLGGAVTIEHLRRSANRATPVVLLISPHRAQAYRRPVRNLYGADDAIELPEADKLLVSRVRALWAGHAERV